MCDGKSGRTPDLEDEVVAAPASAIAPDRLRQLGGKGELVASGLIPAHARHQRIPAIADPVHVACCAVEPERQAALVFGHLKGNALTQRNADLDPVRERRQGDRTDHGARGWKARWQWPSVRCGHPGFRLGGQPDSQLVVQAGGHQCSRAGGEKPLIRPPRQRPPGGETVGLPRSGGVVVELGDHG
jgi:hypothetical protein